MTASRFFGNKMTASSLFRNQMSDSHLLVNKMTAFEFGLTMDYENYYSVFYGIPNLQLHGYYDALIIFILLVAGVCVSMPALIWAFHVLYTVYKQGGRISTFIILLIINDLVELLLSAFFASYVIDSFVQSSATKSLKQITNEEHMKFYLFMSNSNSNSKMLFPYKDITFIKLLITCRISGLYLHQLVALQCMLSLKNQLGSTHFFSPVRSTITCVILWLLAYGCQFLNIWLYLILSFLPSCILGITCILTYKASAASDHIKPGSAVLIVSTLTLITFCATAGVVVVYNFINSIHEFTAIYHNIPAFLISLRVITDPLLCVLVSKEQFRFFKLQTQTHK